MLYRVFKIPARLAFYLYVRHLRVNRPELFEHKGPLLIAANHPNSFLDAIILATLFRRPIFSLARGDVFGHPIINFLLQSVRILPVYRMSEGSEHLNRNYLTFESCRNIFKKDGIVLIFSEGRCIHEWALRPLMKGTARLAFSSLEEGIDLTILPVGINYHAFGHFGKNLQIRFGEPFRVSSFTANGYGKSLQEFNRHLQQQLEPLVISIPDGSATIRKKHFQAALPGWQKWLLFIPAVLGFLLHAPLYYPVKWAVQRLAKGSGHEDSLVVGILFFVYPVFVFLLAWFLSRSTDHPAGLLMLLIMPLLARCAVLMRERY